jgi:hypothetical protein
LFCFALLGLLRIALHCIALLCFALHSFVLFLLCFALLWLALLRYGLLWFASVCRRTGFIGLDSASNATILVCRLIGLCAAGFGLGPGQRLDEVERLEGSSSNPLERKRHP